MKKAITTILSVLMLISCLTVNVFAEVSNQQTQTEQTPEETLVGDATDVTDGTNGLEASGVSENETKISSQADVEVTVTVDNTTVNLVQAQSGFWDFDFNANNAYNIYQAIAFEKRHFVVSYNGIEIHGNCSESANNKFNIEIKDGWYAYVYNNEAENLSFDLRIDAGVNAKLGEFTPTVTIGDKDYGFARVGESNLYTFNPGEGFIPPDNFDFSSCTIDVLLNNDRKRYMTNSSGNFEGNKVEQYIILWHKSDDGFDNICLALSAGNGPEDGLNNKINDAQLRCGNRDFPLCIVNFNNGKFLWFIDFGSMNDDSRMAYYDYINSGNTSFQVKYRTEGSEQYQYQNIFSLGLIDDFNLYGKHAVVDVEGEKNYFVLNPNTPAIDMDNIDSIEVTMNGETRTVNLTKSEVIDRYSYYKPDSPLPFNKDSSFDVTVISRNNRNTYEGMGNYYREDKGSVILEEQSALLYDKARGSYVVICTNYEVTDKLSSSYIKLINNEVNFNCNINNNNTEYFWTFNVSIEQLYSGDILKLSFKNNTTESITFYQTQDSINQSGPVKIEKTEEGFDVYVPFDNEIRFEAKNGDSIQKHFINMGCNFDDIMDRTPIAVLGFNKGKWFNTYDSIFNYNSHKFDSISVGAQLENDRFKSLANEVRQGNYFNLENYYSLTLKEGYYFVGNPVCEVTSSNRGKIIRVSYNVSNGEESCKIVLNIEQDSSSNVFVGDKEFYLEDTIDNTKVYISLPKDSYPKDSYLDFDAQEIVSAVNSENVKHSAIFVDYECNYIRNDNRNDYPSDISDGYEVEPVWSVSLNLFYLDNADLLNSEKINSDSLLSFEEPFNNAINTRLEYSNFENYEGAYEHRLNTELKLPYKVNDESLTAAGQENLNQHSEVNVWITHEIRKDRIIFYRNMSFNNSASVTYYDIFSEDDVNYNPSRVIFVGGEGNNDYPADSEGLEKAINELRHSGKSAVVLKENVNLNRNVNMKHVTVERSEIPESALHDIEINLNGHNINTNGYSLVNLRTSTVHITNYVVDENGRSTDVLNSTAKIIGNSDKPAIENYGGLYVLANITVENKQGTGVVTYNSGDLFLGNGTKVDANVCVDIVENEMFSDGRTSANINIKGELAASNVAIQSTTVKSDVVNNIRIFNQSVNNTVQKVKINAGNTGIKTVGNVKIDIYGCEMSANNPIIMSGGTIEVKHADFSSRNGSPIILVDSNHSNSTNTTILIAAEANVSMSTTGALIKEVSNDASKIDSIYFYSINPHDESYFDYGNGRLFEFSNTPEYGAILINGGCFLDQSYQNYLQGAALDEKTEVKEGKTYYYNLKYGNKSVSSYTDLKAALEDSSVDSVRLSQDINAPSGSVIRFNVNSPKVLFTNGYTIRNVKLVPVTTIASSPKAFFTVDNEAKDTGGLINSGTVIESSANQVFVRYADVVSSGDVAIKINRGEFFGLNNQASRTIEGTKAIEVNVGNTNNTVGNISINDYNLIGTAGPAIDVVKTNVYSYLNLDRCNVKSAYNDAVAESEATSASSAIRINDRTRISAQNSTVIEGTRYGVYFTDTLPDTGFVNNYAGMQFGKKTKVTADIAFRLGNYTVVHFDDVYAYAKTSVMELHGFTQYVITSGEYSVSEGNDVISFVGVNPEDNYNWHRITGGYYSHEIPDNEIFNAPNYKYVYDCVPVSLSNNPLPWVVARRDREQNNYQYIEVPAGRDVNVDGEKLDNAYDKEETSGYDSFDVVLTVKYKNDPETKQKFDGHGNGFKEYYDIHVDKVVDNSAIDNVDSTKNYQLVTIPLTDLKLDNESIIYAKIDNVKVYHKHSNSDPVVLKKISKDKANNAKEECYYLDNVDGNWYLNIITRKFSDFAIAEDENTVVLQDLKPDYVLTLQYAGSYYKDNFAVPEYAVYGNNQRVSIEDVDVVYYNAEGTDYYYGSQIPDRSGNYIAEWTVKEGKDITGYGTKRFSLLREDLSLINIKNNLAYTGSNVELIENIEDIKNYRFELIDSANNKSIFDGVVPVAKNAGTYKLWYSNNGITEFIGNIVISKAEPVNTIPDDLSAVYNSKLSDIELTGGWYWVNSEYVFDNVGNKIVKAKIDETDNYLGAERDVTVNVRPKKAPRPELPKYDSVVYGTTLGNIKLTGTWKWTDESIVPDVNNSGYEAYIIVDDIHFDWSDYSEYNASNSSYKVTLKPVVTKADPVYSVPTNLTTTYGNTLSNVTLPNGWAWVNSETSVGNATTTGNKFDAIFTPSDNNNYNSVLVELNVVVNKANPIDTNSSTLVAVYGDKITDLDLTGGWYWANKTIVFSEIGEVKVTAKIDETDNYKSSTKEVTVTVNKKQAETPVKPTAEPVVYGVTLADVTLSDSNWQWIDNKIKPTVTNNGYQAYIKVDDTHYNWTGIDGYDSEKHRYVAAVEVKVSKADNDISIIGMPEIDEKNEGTILNEISLGTGWYWLYPNKEVGDSNPAIYNPDKANFNDLLVNIPVKVKHTINDKTVTIETKVEDNRNSNSNVVIENNTLTEVAKNIVSGNGIIEVKDEEVLTLIQNASPTDKVEISLNLKTVEKSITNEEKNILLSKGISIDDSLETLDFKVTIQVSVNDSTVQETTVTKLPSELEFSYPLPENAKIQADEGKTLQYYMLRIHVDKDGNVSVDRIDLDLNRENRRVSVPSGKFSTYILMVEEIDISTNNNTPSYVPSDNKKPVVNTAAK